MSISSHTWSLWRYFQLSHWRLCSPICCCCFLLCNQPLSQVTQETQTLPGYCSPVVWVPTWQCTERSGFNPAAPPCICSDSAHVLSAGASLSQCHSASKSPQGICTVTACLYWEKMKTWTDSMGLQWNLLSKQATQAVQPITSEITEQLKWTSISGNGNTVLKQYKHWNSW